MLACLGTYQGKWLDSKTGVCLILNMSNCLPADAKSFYTHINQLSNPTYFHFPAESLAANLHFSLMKQKDTSGHLRSLQDSVSLPVWIQVNLSFEHEVLFWAFCPLVLTCIWHQRQFVSTECHLGIFSWFWCVSDVKESSSMKYYLDIFANWSDMCLPLRVSLWTLSVIWHFYATDLTCVMSGTVCVGQVFIWWSSWGTCDSSVFWCVSIFHLCDWCH